MTVYSIIGYKPNEVDSVMGCVQDRVDSDFDFETFTDVNMAAAYVAKLEMELPYSQFIAHSWEITVLFDGQPEDDFRYDPITYEELPDNLEIIKTFQQLVDGKIQEIKYEREEAKKAERERKLAKEKAQKEKTLKEKEKYEREQYEYLKNKFES